MRFFTLTIVPWDVNSQLREYNYMTPLMMAYTHDDNQKTIDLLLEHGADASLKDKYGMNAKRLVKYR